MKKLRRARSKEGLSTLVLPKDNSEMQDFIEEHRSEVFGQVVENIGHAVKNRWTAVEVFSFHKSNFVVFIHMRDFRDNVLLAYEFGMEIENYELCDKAKKVIDLIDRLSFVINYTIQPKKTNVEAETPPKKTTKRTRKK